MGDVTLRRTLRDGAPAPGATSVVPGGERIARPTERGVLVRGDLALIDAHVVRFLARLRQIHGPVWVAPDRALLPTAVPLHDLRYALGQLAVVAGVGAPAPGAVDLPVVRFPQAPLASLGRSLGLTREAEPDPPGAVTVDMILAARPQPLVLLTGCFDLIHAGHLRLIELAAQAGARPVVAALTSRAIRQQPKNWGRGDRPLWSQRDRLTVLQALRTEPRTLLLDGPDSIGLIRKLRPDLWIKSVGDRGRAIVEEEARLVERLGGRALWLDTGRVKSSSTRIASAIRDAPSGAATSGVATVAAGRVAGSAVVEDPDGSRQRVPRPLRDP